MDCGRLHTFVDHANLWAEKEVATTHISLAMFCVQNLKPRREKIVMTVAVYSFIQQY